MNLNALIGVVSTLALLFPVALMVAFRLYYNRSLQALLIYYFLGFIYNLMVQGIIPLSVPARKIFGTFYNYLDTPLMLLFLTFFYTGVLKVKVIYGVLAAFLIYELAIGFIYGFNAG